MKRTVYYISDGTGITANTLGRSLLTQFEHVSFEEITVPYVNTHDKAVSILKEINGIYQRDGLKPIIFATLVNKEIHDILSDSKGIFMDFFKTFIGPLEEELELKSTHTVGRSHGLLDYNNYMLRINAVNYALSTDDGINYKDYDKADFILVGVSRCGKTPTCLYLALNFGAYAANYPFTEEDISHGDLPAFLKPFRHKIYGLTIEAQRLNLIRHIPFINTSTRSIEEIAAEIVARTNFKRRIY